MNPVGLQLLKYMSGTGRNLYSLFLVDVEGSVMNVLKIFLDPPSTVKTEQLIERAVVFIKIFRTIFKEAVENLEDGFCLI